MGRNSKPRKKRAERPALLQPIVFGISEEHRRNLALVPHAELTKLQNGAADEGTWHTVTCRLNFGAVLARTHDFGMDLKPQLQAALDAMVVIQERHARTEKWGARGDEQHAIGWGLVYTDDMEGACTRRQHMDALRIVLADGTQ